MYRPILVISAKIVILLMYAINAVSAKEQQNLNILQESFEQPTQDDGSGVGWTLTHRESLWKVTSQPLDSNNSRSLRLSSTTSRSGQSSLTIGPWSFSTDTSVFVSKYFIVPEQYTAAPLVVSFWSLGKDTSNLKINVDISYYDNSYLFMEISPSAHANVVDKENVFTRTCAYLPNYGRIRAVMLHVVLNKQLDSVIYLDDISVEYISTSGIKDMTSCQLYTSSFPQRRHVMTNFLTRTKTRKSLGGVTLSTQLTMDRFKNLEHIARVWKGPVSAAVMLFGPTRSRDELKEVVTQYYSSALIQNYVTVHIIWEDMINGGDSLRYPINYLRNIALSENGGKSYVFLLDADIIPGFSERQAYKWVNRETSKTNEDKWAFIAPTFNVEHTVSEDKMPKTKEKLLELLDTKDSGFDILRVVSHGVIGYKRWMVSKQSYEVKYLNDMEPYFIVSSEAPLMSDIYAGYGRDKCAYSNDLHTAGYKFLVLPEAFILNHLDSPAVLSNTMYRRSNGLQLRVFLNIVFHNADKQAGFFHYPAHYRQSSDIDPHEDVQHCTASDQQCHNTNEINTEKRMHHYQKVQQDIVVDDKAAASGIHSETIHTREVVLNSSSQAVNVDDQSGTEEGVEIKTEPTKVQDKSPLTTIELDHVESESKNSIVDTCIKNYSDLSNIKEMTSLPRSRRNPRIDQTIEDVMEVFGVHSVIDLPSNAKMSYSTYVLQNKFYLQLLHADSIISLVPNDVKDIVTTEGVFECHRSTGSALKLISDVIQTHPEPKLYIIDIADDSLSEESAIERITACLTVATGMDVILINGDDKKSKSTVFWRRLHTEVCHRGNDWKMYRLAQSVIIKSMLLKDSPGGSAHPVSSPPACLARFEADRSIIPERASSHHKGVTDVILITKNRPLQTYAFVESLINHVTGVHTLWIVMKSEADVFDKGYALLKDCLTSKALFHIELIAEQNKHMGSLIADILTTRSTAPFIMFAVDEMIWLRPVNLDIVSAILLECDPDISIDNDLDISASNSHDQSRDTESKQGADNYRPGKIATVQLRLGENIDIYKRIIEKDIRFSTISGNPDLVAFYPRRLPYDFGYILNIDGVMAQRSDIIADFQLAPGNDGKLAACRKPMCIEQGWLMTALHKRSKQWQLMYRHSRVVNNMGLQQNEGGSVAGRRDGDVSQGSHDVAQVLVVEKKKIDVNSFAKKYGMHGQAHTTYPIEYIPLQCT